MSEPDTPPPEPGDTGTTEVRTPDEAPFSTPAAFSSPTPPPDPPAPEIPPDTASPADKAAQVASDKPEVLVGAAFAGGLALAFLLKRLGG